MADEVVLWFLQRRDESDIEFVVARVENRWKNGLCEDAGSLKIWRWESILESGASAPHNGDMTGLKSPLLGFSDFISIGRNRSCALCEILSATEVAAPEPALLFRGRDFSRGIVVGVHTGFPRRGKQRVLPAKEQGFQSRLMRWLPISASIRGR